MFLISVVTLCRWKNLAKGNNPDAFDPIFSFREGGCNIARLKVNIISQGIRHKQRLSDCCCLSGPISNQLFFSLFRIFAKANVEHNQIEKQLFIRRIQDGCLQRGVRLDCRQ